MLIYRILEEFHNFNLTMDFHEIKLTQKKGDSPLCYKGPGLVQQSSEGQLQFRMYYNSSLSEAETFRLMNTKAGERIPQEAYYEFTGTDLYDRTWHVDRIRRGYIGGIQSSVLLGNIFEIKFKEQESSVPNQETIHITIYGNYDLPSNINTKIVELLDGTEHKVSWRSNVAKTETPEFGFLFKQEKEWLNVSLISPSISRPKILANRVCESLSFIFGKRLDWASIEARFDNKHIIILRSIARDEITPKIQPPLNIKEPQNYDYVWEIFDKYFDYIVQNCSEQLHPISSYLYDIIESRSGSFYRFARALAVSIEGFLKQFYKDYGTPDESFLAAVKEGKKIVEKISHKRLKKRVSGFFAAVLRTSAKDRLLELIENDIIDKTDVEAWQHIRNYSVHDGKLAHPNTDELIDDTYVSLVLFYLIVFNLIGYTGKYTNYRIKGWPDVMVDESKA